MKLQEINSLFRQDKEQEKILSDVCDHLKHKYTVDAYFCRITGKRWSFMAGSKDVEIPRHRFQLNSDKGVIVEDIDHLQEQQWREILDTIKSNIN